MKLALFTLMSCLIALSWQQHHHHYRQPAANPYWPLPLNNHRGPQHQQQLPYYYQEPHQNYPSFNPYYPGPYSPFAPSYPNYYKKKIPNRSYSLDELKLAALFSQQQQQQQQQLDEAQLVATYYPEFKDKVVIAKQPDQPLDEEAFKKFLLDADDAAIVAEEEEKSKNNGLTSEQQQKLKEEIEGRGIGALLLGYQILTTSTSFKFVTSTITSTSIISCIASASFYGGSTQTCRRKRAAAEIEADEDQMPFDPSPVNSVEPSTINNELNLNRPRRSAELVSSFEQIEDRNSIEGAKMTPYDSFVRANRGIGLGSTITSTVTTYSISTTSSKKTISIGSSLSCLPSGYSLC